MYTLTPLADPNLSHSGFFVAAVVALILLILAIDECSPFVGFLSILCLGIPGYFSYFVDLPVPSNEPVVADLVGEEEYVANDGPKGRAQTHLVVAYRTPEGVVLFTRERGLVYPARAVLYKQNQK